MTRRERTTAWLLYLATLVSAIPLAALVAYSTPMPEGACSGIGWGCSLYGWDAAAFALLLLGLPYAVVLAVVLALLSLLPDRHIPVATGVAGVGLAVPWVVVLYAIVGSPS